MEEMIWIILISLAILDTAIGNYLLPCRVGVVKSGYEYRIYKWQRLFLIPVKGWYQEGEPERNIISFLGSYKYATIYQNKESAVQRAKWFSNQLKKEEEQPAGEIVWTSKRPKGGYKPESEEDLTLQLGQALIEGRKEDGDRIMLRLKELKYI